MACIGVIDVETTGLKPYRNDRVVELAALIIHPDGTVLRKFVTLLNPDRDLGPTCIHGLSARDTLVAPRFSEIAGALLEVFDGCVAVAGHNVRFDHSFLAAEFGRLGYSFPDGPLLCTMRLAGGGNLPCACSDYGIAVEGDAHTAWHDARATAQLLVTLLKDAPRLAAEISGWPPIVWPDVPRSPARLVTRDDSRRREAEPPIYIQRLLTRVLPDTLPDDENSAMLAYTDLLTRVLEDRRIDDEEGEALLELATRWGMPANQIRQVNRDYLLRLAEAALADGVLADSERRDLGQVASLLGIDSRDLAESLETAAHELAEGRNQPPLAVTALSIEDLAGKRVCFTGESRCRLSGESISREMAAELAARRGMIVAESVTKKLDLLVVADPFTQSGKATKARRYQIRIIHESVFWRALGLEVG
jgi:DNA polymerase-3 subunit epsilon